jgi:hypothetical protein
MCPRETRGTLIDVAQCTVRPLAKSIDCRTPRRIILPRPSARLCTSTPCPSARLRRWRQRRPLRALRSWPRRPRSAAVAPPPGAPWATRSAAGAAARRRAQKGALGKRRPRGAQAPLGRARQLARRLKRWCRWNSWSRRCPCRRVLSGACVPRIWLPNNVAQSPPFVAAPLSPRVPVPRATCMTHGLSDFQHPVSQPRRAGQNAALALEERNSALELRLHGVASDLTAARRALAARDDHVSQMAAELRAAKVCSTLTTVA